MSHFCSYICYVISLHEDQKTSAFRQHVFLLFEYLNGYLLDTVFVEICFCFNDWAVFRIPCLILQLGQVFQLFHVRYAHA